MNWEQDPYERSYTVTSDTFQAIVSKASTGEWTALVSQYGAATAHHTFSILTDAQAWCEAHIAQMQPKEREAGA